MSIKLAEFIKESDFNQRIRYARKAGADSGEKAQKRGLDRGFIGLRICGRGWLQSIFPGAGDSELASCFVLGIGHIAFVIAGDSIIANSNNGAQAVEYVKAFARMKGKAIEYSDSLPTGERQAGGLSLDQLLEKAGKQESEYSNLF